MVRDMFNILDVHHRFLPAYGLSKTGTKLSAIQAQRARIALSRTSDAAAKARVDAELHNRGGFIPLMGHFPVMRFAAAGRSTSGAGASTQVAANAGQRDQEISSDDDDAEQPAAGAELQQAEDDGRQAAAGQSAAAAVGSQAAGGVHFTDSDKRLFVYMQQWWQKHKAAGKRRRKRLKTGTDGEAAVAMQVEEPAAA